MFSFSLPESPPAQQRKPLPRALDLSSLRVRMAFSPSPRPIHKAGVRLSGTPSLVPGHVEDVSKLASDLNTWLSAFQVWVHSNHTRV